ncbi:EAL domain-containing protein [Siccirubricoccus sp. KC 17139]|uniref:EAL domain-containing protein n=1 Tax=Siccirubricoccus soli TaxID=2899147 RepID=A0ABT1D8V0_9PROT|nr:EAL domain-containing protein [Siccirubricoccus soli]MCO6418370.1 EAL domain-containing protein [Siccirubricoccus soli]MCP2684505.1 EAL domain-containing protein [Siccirubricoccus soli]
MPSAPLPENEVDRIAALQALQVLDTPREDRFDLFARLAADIAGTPMAAVTLVDAARQWFKASVGLQMRETPRELAFCAHAILGPAPLVVEDAAADPRFAANPLVIGGPGFRFYAGVPLVQRDGQAVGTLCVFDTVPRRLTARQLHRMAELAQGVMSTLEMHAALKALGALAAQDPLTGCVNRGALHVALAKLGGAGAPATAVLCLDLDRFKEINDLLGHAAGDAALREVARRLRAAVREHDLVGRLGGDEFVVLAKDLGCGEDAMALARRIHAAFAEPFSFEGQPIRLRTTLGLALYPADAPDGEAALRLADAALYRAKRSGFGTVRHLADAERGGVAGGGVRATLGRDEIASELRLSLAGEPGSAPLLVAWQPIFSAALPRRLVDAEALVRWPRRVEEAALGPGDFLPAAERHGLMARLDRHVLRAACREAAGWAMPLGISVNLSAPNFLTVDLVSGVEAALAESGLAPERLTLEVTESALIGDMARARGTLSALRRIGVRLALDDFGTGHSSLAYLRDLPFDKVKIDRSFIGQLAEDPRALVLVRAILQLARGLGLATIAEGVETSQQLAMLQTEGVDGVQGYLLGRPGPAELFLPVRDRLRA